MVKAKGVAVGFGIAAGILAAFVGIFWGYAMFQGSAEKDYINEINTLASDLNEVGIEVNKISMDVLANRISVTQAKFQLSSLINDVEKLHQHASSMNVPEKYKDAQPHIIRGLDYYSSALKSSKDAIQYTENALQASQQLETILYADIISAILGSGSLQSLSVAHEVYSNTEAAKATYNDANRYSRQATDEFTTYFSMTNLLGNLSFSDATSERVLKEVAKQEQVQECKSLGIPEFSCTEQTLLAKRRLVAAGQQGAYGSGKP